MVGEVVRSDQKEWIEKLSTFLQDDVDIARHTLHTYECECLCSVFVCEWE